MTTDFIPGKTLVHVAGQCFDERERHALADLAGVKEFETIPGYDFDTTWPLQLTAGRRHAELEKRLAKRFGVKHALLVNSGSSANLLAVSALGLRPGDEVITVACAFPTTVAPIVQCGATPVFVDVGFDGNIDCSQLLDAVSPRTRAVVIAHALGFPFDLDRVLTFCEDHDLRLVADCCDAAGATWRGRQVTAMADVSTLSFYPAHHMTTGEGGCVLTDRDDLAKIVRSLRDWGRDCTCPPDHDNTCGARFEQSREVLGSLPAGYDHKYVYSRLGYNLKMTEMQAAIGLVQLDKLDGFIARRKETWTYYADALAGVVVSPQAHFSEPGDPSPFGFLILSPDRDRIVRELEKRRIQTRPLFAGNLLRHPAMRAVECRIAGGGYQSPDPRPESRLNFSQLPNTERLMREAFWIGVYPGVTDEMREWVVKSLREIVR